MRPTTLATLVRFASPAERSDAARDLASQLEVDAVLLFVKDPELGVPLPAPGFPQTLVGRPDWNAFKARWADVGRHRAVVTSPVAARETHAVAQVSPQGTVLVLLGGAPDDAALDELVEVMPLVDALLRAEIAAQFALGETAAAREAGRHANELAVALDLARGELQQALGDAAMLNERLVEADRRKDEFLAMLGHELRNPMSAIAAALALMRVRANDPGVVARASAIIERQSQHLSRLVDDLLDVARVTQGKISLSLEPVDVSDVARRAADTAGSLIASKKHLLRLHVGDDAWASADRTRLEQMITNLLTNAAKYTDPGGTIDLGISREGGDVIVRVRDSGIGIEPAMLEHVFDPFMQIAPTLERSDGGMGIGLTLVRQLAALHGGRAQARSTVGEGSEFSIVLPAIERPLAGPSATTTPARASGDARRVLIVDDNVDSADMVNELVSSWGHETRQAGDGHEALAIAESFRPDVVFLDLGLPGIDGYEVAQRLRRCAATERSRIVAVSGYGTASDRAKTALAGFDAHLVKPVDLAELERLLGP